MLPVSAVYDGKEVIYREELQSSTMLSLLPAGLKPGIIRLDYDMDWGNEYVKNRFASRPSRNGSPE